ncbi:hypothetical protein Alches_12030 [Alicyclobacillus hesperidum subsp. aegles]|uniref:hypothetical protein n=1 Tax=Alicyclobacillus hesperidum TaxID=89784 RepID=UPI0007190F00|nr:hypothetical protein [Alicyclobacillus hesperidum]KRW92463.1 hypothetical protein SD51_02855 [Alicyclobacillus tengchongensis]GLG01164.1 hypothetical protein Alches_12030 [Alicyclobacillus hesperidum subsp. aegles]
MNANYNNQFEEQFREFALETDKEDLLAILRIRFGEVPPNAKAFIMKMSDATSLERLILVASNVPDWKSFLNELQESVNAFRIAGEQYRPV